MTAQVIDFARYKQMTDRKRVRDAIGQTAATLRRLQYKTEQDEVLRDWDAHWDKQPCNSLTAPQWPHYTSQGELEAMYERLMAVNNPDRVRVWRLWDNV